MLPDLDTLIFVGFLAINLAVGLFYSRGTKSVTEYSVGARNFSTSALVATIVATHVDGAAFSIDLTESYRQGLYYIVTGLAFLFRFSFVGYVLIPRMSGFLSNLSVAEAIGKFYGNYARCVAAVFGIILSVGYVAIQFKIAASLMQLFFPSVSSFYAMTAICAIVILYSTFGGISAVTFTDVLQFFTFGVVIPFICITIWSEAIDDPMRIFNVVSSSPVFDLQQVFDINNPLCLSMLSLLLVCTIPAFDPAFFQRISMASGILQAKKSFVIAGFFLVGIYGIISWIAVIIFADNPNLNPDSLLTHIIETYTDPGVKGLVAIGVMACIMSTADSYMNSASILLGHDIFKVLNLQSISQNRELLLLRASTCLTGLCALLLAYSPGSLLDLYMKMLSLYMPVVSVPLYMAIFGFRTSGNVILTGMAAGLVSIILCSIFADLESSEVIIGMLANLIATTLAHLSYNKSDRVNSENVCSENYKQSYLETLGTIKNFSLRDFYQNSVSRKSSLYVLTGAFSIIILLTSHHGTLKELQAVNFTLFSFIYLSYFICSTALLLHPILPDFLKNKVIYSYLSLATTSYILVFVPFLLVALSNFGALQVVMLLTNISIFFLIIRWRAALTILASVSYLSIKFYELFVKPYTLDTGTIELGLQFKITYTILFISGILIAFFKPEQEAYDLSEKMVDHLSHAIEDQKNQILDLSNLKQVFLRNLQHETNTPLTGVYSMSQALSDCYDKLDEEQRKKAVCTIASSSARLISYVQNIFDVSKLISTKPHVNMRETNLSNLVYEVLRKCNKIYITRKTKGDRDFILNIESNVISECDEYYLRRGFENLIINAIQYCNKGIIEISLSKSPDQNKVIFSVKDSGIGIPEEDMSDIFEPFVTSGKTITPAGGRGLGLSFVKEVARMHRGEVTVTSDGSRGSCFTMSLFVT